MNTYIVILIMILGHCFSFLAEGMRVKAIFCSEVGGVSHDISHSGLDILFAEIENDLMTMSTLLKSQYSFEFRQQMEDWMQSLQDLGKYDIQGKKSRECC